MPKKTDRSVLLRAYLLRQQGNTLDDVMEGLWSFFDDAAVPDRSTISRNLKKFSQISPQEYRQDQPFSWGDMDEIPWHASKSVLAMYSWYLEGEDLLSGIAPVTQRLLKWMWRVSEALPEGENYGEKLFQSSIARFLKLKYFSERIPLAETDANFYKIIPTDMDVFIWAREYSLRELAATFFKEPIDTMDIDLCLAMGPWRNPDRFLRYHSVLENRPFDYVDWHIGDVDFMALVAPDGGKSYGQFVSSSEARARSDRDAASKSPDSLFWHIRANDGLTPSQCFLADGLEEHGVDINIWYVKYRRWANDCYRRDDWKELKNYMQVIQELRGEYDERLN